MPQNAAKRPSPPPQNSITESEAPPTVCVNLSLQDHGDVQTLSMNCINRDIGRLVKNCNCGAPQFLHVWTSCLVATTTGMSPPVQELHLWNLHRLQRCTTTGTPQPVQELSLWNLHGLQPCLVDELQREHRPPCQSTALFSAL